ncbi:MAG: acireductone synthase [Woeseiaceae bacterium]
MNPRVILTDIEGTTSAISFVHDVLFPYASEELAEFVRDNEDDPDVEPILQDARAEAEEPGATTERLIEIMQEWIAEDRKVTPLKALQGHIWRNGYESGDFTGHMYDDAVEGLHRWHDAEIDLYVYSSGSVGAQKLLFGYSDAGDLTNLFSGYFDTNIGHKKEADAYERIAIEIETPPAEILFLSDVAEELDAARIAGMQTIQLVRDEDVIVGDHPVASSFDDVIIDTEE